MRIFVFGSNLSGFHGAGAASFAVLHHGAEMRVGEGRTGDAYALPTKERDVATTRPLDAIRESVDKFIAYAREHPELTFQVTRVGCGLAGYTDDEIGPMFREAPENCDLPTEPVDWRSYGRRRHDPCVGVPGDKYSL